MKLRSALIGTAAVVLASNASQAADLAIAVEPIDYVKICDAFGVGYWYIPGTDTCLKIGGYVQLDVWFYDDDRVGDYANIAQQLTGSTTDPSDPLSSTSGAVAGYLYAQDDYSQSWEMKTEAGAEWNSRSMSDLGVIATSMNFVVTSDNNSLDGTAKTVRFDGGYGAIGPIMFGWTTSTFDPGGGYTYDGAVRSDIKADQVRLSYLMGTWGIMLGLEDPRDRYAGATNATGNYPDIVLAVTGGVGGLDLRAAVAVTDRTSRHRLGRQPCCHRQARRRGHQGHGRLLRQRQELHRRLQLQRHLLGWPVAGLRRRRVVERLPVGCRGAQRQHEGGCHGVVPGRSDLRRRYADCAPVVSTTTRRLVRRSVRNFCTPIPDSGDSSLGGHIRFKTHFN